MGAIRSPITAKLYKRNLAHYMQTQGFARYEDMLKEESKVAQNRIEKFILKKKASGLSSVTIQGYLNTLRHFYFVNEADSGINWKLLRKYKGEYIKKVEDKPYTTEQIRHMLSFCDHRKRVILLLPASSGMRIGAVAVLKVGDLTPVFDNKIYQINVYAGTNDKYITFCTPECKKAIDDYLDYRRRFGEVITSKSWLIREQFDQNDELQAKHPWKHAMSDTHIKMLVFRLLIQAGLRENTGDMQRKENMMTHALRKFFKVTCRRSGVDPLILELFMGHKSGGGGISKLAMIYEGSKVDEMELLGQYLKAADNLTINDEYRLEKEVLELKDKLKDAPKLEIIQQSLVAKELEIDAMKKELEKLKSQQPPEWAATVNEIWEELNRIKRGEPSPEEKRVQELINRDKERVDN